MSQILIGYRFDGQVIGFVDIPDTSDATIAEARKLLPGAAHGGVVVAEATERHRYREIAAADIANRKAAQDAMQATARAEADKRRARTVTIEAGSPPLRLVEFVAWAGTLLALVPAEYRDCAEIYQDDPEYSSAMTIAWEKDAP